MLLNISTTIYSNLFLAVPIQLFRWLNIVFKSVIITTEIHIPQECFLPLKLVTQPYNHSSTIRLPIPNPTLYPEGVTCKNDRRTVSSGNFLSNLSAAERWLFDRLVESEYYTTRRGNELVGLLRFKVTVYWKTNLIAVTQKTDIQFSVNSNVTRISNWNGEWQRETLQKPLAYEGKKCMLTTIVSYHTSR